jgi:hypothetical protein
MLAFRAVCPRSTEPHSAASGRLSFVRRGHTLSKQLTLEHDFREGGLVRLVQL